MSIGIGFEAGLLIAYFPFLILLRKNPSKIFGLSILCLVLNFYFTIMAFDLIDSEQITYYLESKFSCCTYSLHLYEDIITFRILACINFLLALFGLTFFGLLSVGEKEMRRWKFERC